MKSNCNPAANNTYKTPTQTIPNLFRIRQIFRAPLHLTQLMNHRNPRRPNSLISHTNNKHRDPVINEEDYQDPAPDEVEEAFLQVGFWG